MRATLVFGVLIAAAVAFGHAGSLVAAPQNNHGNGPKEAQYGELKRAVHKSQMDLERFAGLVDQLEDSARKSNSASRHSAVGQILHEMLQEIRQVNI